MERNRGVALILALLVLSFLTVLGGALLTTSAIDIWISDNYKSATQSLYLAEAGIDHAREVLRTSGLSTTDLLHTAAGPDHLLMTADDLPLIPSHQLSDVDGQAAGFYEVWIRNDYADGIGSVVDSNEIVTLVSQSHIGGSGKELEVAVEKGGFPNTDSDPRLQTVAGLENLASSITTNATDIYTLPTMTDFGGPSVHRVAVVNSDLQLGPGTGYGLLLVRGQLHIVGAVTWNGLILVIGRGVLHANAGVTETVNGGQFVAQTRAADGSLLSVPAGVMFTINDVSQIKAANQPFPYSPIAVRER